MGENAMFNWRNVNWPRYSTRAINGSSRSDWLAALRSQSTGRQAPGCISTSPEQSLKINLRTAQERQLLPSQVFLQLVPLARFDICVARIFFFFEKWEFITANMGCTYTYNLPRWTLIDTPVSSTYCSVLMATFFHSPSTLGLVTSVYWWDFHAPFNLSSYPVRPIFLGRTLRELPDACHQTCQNLQESFRRYKSVSRFMPKLKALHSCQGAISKMPYWISTKRVCSWGMAAHFVKKSIFLIGLPRLLSLDMRCGTRNEKTVGVTRLFLSV